MRDIPASAKFMISNQPRETRKCARSDAPAAVISDAIQLQVYELKNFNAPNTIDRLRFQWFVKLIALSVIDYCRQTIFVGRGIRGCRYRDIGEFATSFSLHDPYF